MSPRFQVHSIESLLTAYPRWWRHPIRWWKTRHIRHDLKVHAKEVRKAGTAELERHIATELERRLINGDDQ